jgi:hypothetical protein
MRISLISLIGLMICLSIMSGTALADPVKWSAPINQYPNPWSPTAAPPNYQDYYPYAAYGYGGYPGYGGGYGGNYSGQNPAYPQGGFSGNPYQPYYYYGQ